MNRCELVTREIILPKPPIGNKILCVQNYGVYILEKGPAILQGIMCTHAGSGSFAFYDGVPDKNGFFPDEHLKPGDEGYATANGRLIYLANPAIMGMWMAGGGVKHGLTLVSTGQTQASAPFIMATWLPFIPLQKRVLDEPVTKHRSK